MRPQSASELKAQRLQTLQSYQPGLPTPPVSSAWPITAVGGIIVGCFAAITATPFLAALGFIVGLAATVAIVAAKSGEPPGLWFFISLIASPVLAVLVLVIVLAIRRN